MKRAFIGLAVVATAVTVLASAGPASAATGQVTKFKFVGPTASALWSSSTATSLTIADVGVDQDLLVVAAVTANLDSNGNTTGGTETVAEATSGFSFAFDKGQLSSASTSDSGMPATTCAFDANGNFSNCHATTLDLAVTWTGFGPSTHQIFNQHFETGVIRESFHANGTVRSATAIGTLPGSSAGDLVSGQLTFASETETDLCVGC